MKAHSKAVALKKVTPMTTFYIRNKTIWLNYHADGKRYRKTTKLEDTPANIKLVETKLIPALDAKIATGDIFKKKPKTFAHYGDIFLKQKSELKSYFIKSPMYRKVIAFFGERNIDTITRLDIKQYINSLDMKSVSKKGYITCIKEVFELAVDDEILTNNPALNIKLKNDERVKIDFYTKEEVLRLLRSAKGVIKAYLEIAFNTGMRSGEILGLQLSDFRDDGYIHIQRTRTKGEIGSGKNNNAKRTVPFTQEMYRYAKEIQPKDNIFIFGNINDAGLLRSQWSKVCRDAGVPKYKLYATRHTFATLMLRENALSINEIAGLLGHSSPKVTLTHYASVIEAKSINFKPIFELYGHKSVTNEKTN